MGQQSVGAMPARRLQILRRLLWWWRTGRGGAGTGLASETHGKPQRAIASHADFGASRQSAAHESPVLDFDAAIENHLQWTARLRRYGHGDRQEFLDPVQVCRTDACSLGLWLERQTQPSAECAGQIAQIRQEHADFHHKAAVVVTLVQTGASESALQSVDHGDFAHRSRSLIHLLQTLRARCNAGSAQPTVAGTARRSGKESVGTSA
ncbi:MAG: CZB domain-containing protein [Thiomonas sp.]